MPDPSQPLREFEPDHAFFIGLDSDGCVFDSMEIKHKECFAPMFIKHAHLQAASKYAREVWEFVNLYSTTRGCNRFHALLRALELVRERPEVRARQVDVPSFPALETWVTRESRLGNATLDAEVAGGNDDLRPIQAWSHAINQQVASIVQGVPPFPGVRGILESLQGRADAIVISQTPTEALEREWREHELVELIRLIAGQEMGTKTEHLQMAVRGKYGAGRSLMIGDAPGDRAAAEANGALFYPINPGDEEASWARLRDEGLDRFFEERFAGNYQDALLREFESCLPENPPWH
tara:strand:+ start:2071 stop:2952 length:882 start_codon:yes stop_codon:yes gene_type:complete